MRRIKRWAAHSNHKNVLMHTATMMSLQSALELVEFNERVGDDEWVSLQILTTEI